MFPVSLGIKQKHVIKAKFQHLSFKTQAYLVEHEPTVRPKCIYLGAHTWTLQSLFTYGWLPRPSRTPACNWFFQIWPTLHPRRLMSGPPVDCSPKLKSKENFLFIYFIFFFFFFSLRWSLSVPTVIQLRQGFSPENYPGVPRESCSQWVLQPSRDCLTWVSN